MDGYARRRLGAGAAMLATLVATGNVLAEDVVDASRQDGVGEELSAVHVAVVGTEAELELVRDTVGPDGFGGTPARWVRASRMEIGELLARPPLASEFAVRVWIDFSQHGIARLYFADRRGERFLVRAVTLPEGLSSLGRETLGQILELSVRALLEDSPIGMTRSETRELFGSRKPERESDPSPPDAPDAPGAPDDADPSATRDGVASLGAAPAYSARLFASEAPIAHGPGLLLGWINDDGSWQSLIWASVRYELPRTLDTDAVSVEWSTTTVQAGVGLFFRPGGAPLLLGGRLGVGIDLTSITPAPGTGTRSVELTSARTSTAPLLTPSAGVSIPLGPRLAFSAEAFADMYPIRVHYELARDAGATRVLVPYWVRPGIVIRVLLH